MREVQAFMMKLNEKTEEIRKHVKESTKSKTEIKAVTRELVNIVSPLGRKIDVLKAHYTAITEKADSYEEQIARTIQEHDRAPPPQCNGVGVQAEEREITKEISQKKDDEVKQIQRTLNEGAGWDELSEIIDIAGPVNCYKHTEVTGLEALKECKGNIAIFARPNITTRGQEIEEIKTSFHEVMALLKEKLKEGVIEYVKTRTETIIRRGSKADLSRMLSYHTKLILMG
ncbi:hypothetical protein QE152_g27067 [Popillia japonica]|uniref:Uncharacterized protein n=1 Tax=Popillia japonica TaxID=7064 RepID=A0AAW1JW03_POPJA